MSDADERGLTLVELVIGMTMSVLLLGATLTTFEQFSATTRENDLRNDTAELARRALDVQARQLRNVAKRVASPVIDTVSSYDLIFQTADPGRTWVRYCLDTSPPASRERARLWTGELSVASASIASPVTAAMRGACPGSGWTRTYVVAHDVTNRRDGLERELFSFNCTTGSSCTSQPSTYDQIIDITAQTLVDTTPGTGTPELRVVSGVNLRNQNQAPVARFVASPASSSRTIELNAAGSSDYEGRTLNYFWFKQVMPAQASIDCANATVFTSADTKTLWGSAGYLGEGVAVTHTFPAADGAGTRDVGLVVCDPGDRYDSAGIPPEATIAVQIPA